jgi:hypothetical protein
MKKILLSLIATAVILGILPAHAEWGNNVGIQGLRYTSITTATTTVIKSAFCFVHTLTVTGGTAGTIILYANNGASQPSVATWSSTNTPNTYVFDVNLASGCTVTTGAATNITVSYL